jgi:hypothetical protein
MSPHASAPSTATPKQLSYIKRLALQTGTTFTVPRTRRHASYEIERLKGLKASRGTHAEVPRQQLDQAEQPYATAVQPGEVVGFGSAARWCKDASDRVIPTLPAARVGELTELARYSVSGRERVVYGQRINGRVRITDRPASGAGRSYLVERELEQDGYSALKALVADYTQQARALGEIPMASSIVRRQIEHAAA